MSKVITGATVSFAGPDDSGFDLLFQWCGNGDVEVATGALVEGKGVTHLRHRVKT